MNSSRLQSCGQQLPLSLGNKEEKTYELLPPVDFVGPVPGSANDDAAIRLAISSSIRRSKRSREEVVERMSVLLGTKVTLPMLNSYSADSTKSNRMPAAWIRAFCEAVGNDFLLRVIVEAAGLRVIGADEIALMEVGRQYLRQKRAADQVQELEKKLRGVEL